MARNINTAHISSSPPSGGTITHDGTPSTMPTVMSPEGGKYPGDTFAVIPQLDLTNSDGFVNLASRRNHPVAPVNTSSLPPQARDFASTATPVAGNIHYRDAGIEEAKNHPGVIGSGLDGRQVHAYAVTPTNVGLIQMRNTASPSDVGTFTVDDKTTRAFFVQGIHPATPGLYETIAKSYKHFKSLTNIDCSKLSEGCYSVEFSDYRDAVTALNWTQSSLFFGQDVATFNLPPKLIALRQGNNPATVSNHSGEYLVIVNDVGYRVGSFGKHDLFQLCEEIGDVKAFRQVPSVNGAVATFRVEWFDTEARPFELSGAEFKDARLTVKPNCPDILNPLYNYALARQVPRTGQAFDRCIISSPAFLAPQKSNHNNVVDINRIRHDEDWRTTIMLRNIPNRVDQATLKRLLDETSFGRYDFMYLRIDFANNCNVGYAFINFATNKDIIPFAIARAGQKWNLFQSDKVAEISYATIQGIEQLEAKFRNSSVMLEQPAFRPKLYHIFGSKTGFPGTEKRFPPPDNHAKLKRSCDNAEHVGLYHPTSASIFSATPVTDHFPAPPRNQAYGGVYTYPAPNRCAYSPY